MNVKLHYLETHVDYFPSNLCDYIEEEGKRFHQDLKAMEKRYQGRWDERMLADYCWSLKRDLPEDSDDEENAKKENNLKRKASCKSKRVRQHKNLS